MFEILKNAYRTFTLNERSKVVWLLLMTVVVGSIEVAGIASIMPFIAVVSNPEIIHTNKHLSYIYNMLGFDSINNFIVMIGFLVFSVIIFTNLVKIIHLRFELNFVHNYLSELSVRLFSIYTKKPYSFYINSNTTDLRKNILQETNALAHHIIRPILQVLSKSVLVIFITLLLMWVDIVLALAVFFILGGAYALIYFILQRTLSRLGEWRFDANAVRFRIANETFGAIKELRVLGREQYFLKLFAKQARKLERSYATSTLISQMPSFIMEVVAFGGIIIILLYFLMLQQNVEQVIPIMALYAFAGYRLMPTMQGILTSLTTLRFNYTVMDALSADLNEPYRLPSPDGEDTSDLLVDFENSISLKNITFSYPGADFPVLERLNITIEKNSSIGFVGSTGCGKTTIVDIILGLLIPQEGVLLVDNTVIDEKNISSWQKRIGYVPQSCFLMDDTIIHNIALGIPPDLIDMEAVVRSARIANIHEFIMAELPHGYNTVIGEHGICLSGGQRQRISIARALYHDPDVLIMDEATSALDGVTEENIIQSMRELSGIKTTITIAHRVTTLRDCDQIYVLSEGKIVASGKFDQLIESSTFFKTALNSKFKESC